MYDYYSNWHCDFAFWRNRADFTQEMVEANQFIENYVANYNIGKAPNAQISNYATLRNVERWDEFTRNGYENRDDLNRWLDTFDNWLSRIDMGGIFKKQRLIITADNRGVFSFGVASKGLYIPKEFFSEQLALESPDEFADAEKLSGIVPALFVTKRVIFGTEMYFYTSKKMNKEYEVLPQDEGTRAIELKVPDAKIIYKTNTKKAYVMFPKKGGKAKMIDLYLPKNRNISLANIMPSLMIAHFMRLYGVMCRINVLRVWNGSMRIGGYGFMVKDFGDDTDFDNLATQAINDNVWDSIVEGIEGISYAREYGRKFNDKPVNFNNWGNTGGIPRIQSQWDEYMARYRNYYQSLIERGQIDPIRIDKKLMLLGYTSGHTQESIMKEFWRILDIVDMQFNKMTEALPRIYKRYVDEEGKTRLEFKNYVIRLLTSVYSYPVGGDYAESQEDAKKLDDEYQEKIDELTTFLT